uniref:Metallothionein n=1 Tax=Anopheles farauti TaxID=69004 RepID=A0A182Q082_9DIPT
MLPFLRDMPCRTCGKDCKCLRMMSKRSCGCRPCDSDCTCSCNTSSSRNMPREGVTGDGQRLTEGARDQTAGVGCCQGGTGADGPGCGDSSACTC